MPKVFNSTPATFESWFIPKKGKKAAEKDKDLDDEAAEVLHELLRPFFLRRTKEEVLRDLPPKSEIILYTGMNLFIASAFIYCVGMSAMQKKYYKWILTKDIVALNSNARTTLMNNTLALCLFFNFP